MVRKLRRRGYFVIYIKVEVFLDTNDFLSNDVKLILEMLFINLKKNISKKWLKLCKQLNTKQTLRKISQALTIRFAAYVFVRVSNLCIKY